LEDDWRGFNGTYIVIFPPQDEQKIMDLLGDQADEKANYEYAALKAANEVLGLSGRDQFFAYYNRGTNLVDLQDYAGAAAAYDAAFAVYAAIPEDDRPYRALWYQTGPYFAYYFTQRYWDVISLANTTLDTMSEPILEESYYWRARANLALGDTVGAEKDLKLALKYHEGFTPALDLLTELGVNP
jgi:tetratricopeptide (TPR) repeat protein